MITFVIDEGSKMDASLRAMKAHIARCTELFPVLLESSKDGETSYSFLDLTPYDMVKPTSGREGPGGRLHGAHGLAYFYH